VYAADIDDRSPERLALVGQLRSAIELRELAVHYQPKALLLTGEAFGLEALVRWPHPERGVLAPAAFLPLAEHAGLMHDLTICVLERALTDLASLRRRWPALTVAVNVSVPTLLRADFPEEIDRLLLERELPPAALEIEITEDVLMTDAGRARTLVGELRGRGISVAIDDYGTGYSSLRYLRDLEVDWLKVDQSFVRGLNEHSSSARIVESTILLAHALGLRVVAEGIEDARDWSVLSSLRCDAAQGYLLTRPLSHGEIATWLAAYEDELRKGDPRAA
jgi:EAL domain-containing protein (putative c-di-GMP-specific phosphodiesterase class I)